MCLLKLTTKIFNMIGNMPLEQAEGDFFSKDIVFFLSNTILSDKRIQSMSLERTKPNIPPKQIAAEPKKNLSKGH